MGESTDSGSDGDDQPEEKSDEEVPGDQESGTNDHDGDDDADLNKKRKRLVVQREFSPYKSWDLAQHKTADVHAAIRVELAEINDLLTSLKSVDRTVLPTTHAFVLLMPTQKLLKQLIEDDPEIDRNALAAGANGEVEKHCVHIVWGDPYQQVD